MSINSRRNKKQFSTDGTSAGRSESSTSVKELVDEAASGSPAAWLELGWIYQHGEGVSKDIVEAERCYKEAVLLGDLAARFYLGRLYFEIYEYEKAFPLFSTAAEQGHLPSIYWTGYLYLWGKGIARNLEEAEKYLKLAANKGHLYARRDYYLGLFRGTFGKRQLLVGFVGRVSVVLATLRLILSDPDSELMQ